jgi:hypothetical protein
MRGQKEALKNGQKCNILDQVECRHELENGLRPSYSESRIPSLSLKLNGFIYACILDLSKARLFKKIKSRFNAERRALWKQPGWTRYMKVS